MLAGIGLFPIAIERMAQRAVRKRSLQQKTAELRSVSVIVPAYNEQNTIADKIKSLRTSLSMIDVEWEVLIGSDGSTDRTVAIAQMAVQRLGGTWKIIEYQNEGKCRTINKLVNEARGEVVISTDADIAVPDGAIGTVVREFRGNARLGCLSCIPGFSGQDIGSQRQYWGFEQRIRQAESVLGKLIVVTGMLYAFRREVYEEIPDGVMADDLWVPLTVLMRGYACAQSEMLVVPYEKTDETIEIIRRKRVITGGMDVVRRLYGRLVRAPSVFVLVFFHKIARWALPVWLLLLLVGVVLLQPLALLIVAMVASIGCTVLGFRRFLALGYGTLTPLLSLVALLRKPDLARWDHTRS